MGWLYMGWLYVGIALGAAALAILVRRLLNQSAKRLVDPWVCMLAGACFFIIYALAGGHNPLLVAAGLTCVVVSVALLIVNRRRAGSGDGSREVLP
jgi:hypothetical protein